MDENYNQTLTQENLDVLQLTLGNLSQTNAQQALTIANLQAVITQKDKEIKKLKEK